MFTLLYIILAVLGLGFLVFVHELGHYLVARWVGMRVEAFSIGFGTPLLKWKVDHVDWQIGWLPFGGYVKIAGMEFSKDQKVEPHEIPEGFFAQAPWKRIAVALAGPVANFITAFLVLILLWGIGGRVKPFSEYTSLAGYVDPSSQLYEEGVRPGDLLLSYNGHPFNSAKDFLHAGMMEGNKVTIKGEHIDYKHGKRSPFSYTVAPYLPPGSLREIKTIGIFSGASHLIYDEIGGQKENPLPKELPISNSALTYKDQLVWANGKRLFSMEQLNQLINANEVFLKVQRGDESLFVRQPKVPLLDLNTSDAAQNEFLDLYYESGLEGGLVVLHAVPYILNMEGVIESPISFLDEDREKELFSGEIARLQPGDRILSVNGVPVQTGVQVFQETQKHTVVMIVKNGEDLSAIQPLQEEQQELIHTMEAKEINALLDKVGSGERVQQGNYTLLKPFSTIPFSSLVAQGEYKKQWEEQVEARMEAIEQIQDAEKRAVALNQLEQMQARQVLGVILQDRQVEYNPSPFALLSQVVEETLQTLKALFVGSLNPKWLGGPIGIVYIIQQGWRSGIGEALFWMAAISLNLGIFNLLPIPVLDGGYICLSIFEMVTGKKLSARTMERLILPFAILIISLLIFLTFQDVTRLFGSLLAAYF